MSKKRVVWDVLARAALRVAYNHIKKDSVTQAEKVKQEIIEASRKLSTHPEMYPPDKFRQDGDARFRAFEKLNYRVTYFVTDDTVRILRLRHVKQEPRDY